MLNIIEKSRVIAAMTLELDKELTKKVQENFNDVLSVKIHGDIIDVKMLSGYEFWFGCKSKNIESRPLMHSDPDVEQLRADKIEAELIFFEIKKYCKEGE